MKDTRTKTERYEDLYREAMLKQLKHDRAVNPHARGPSRHFTAGLLGGQFGKLGGQSKAITPENIIPLSDRAKVVNRMLKKKLTHKNIALILDIPRSTVANIKSRYDLPRNEED